jgi:hypothetical protein
MHSPSSLRRCSDASYFVAPTFSRSEILQGIRIPYDRKQSQSVQHLGECDLFVKRRAPEIFGEALGISTSVTLHDFDKPIGIVNHKFGPGECSDIFFKTSSPF